MTDIVERLRNASGDTLYMRGMERLVREAADEIERLREELDRCQRAYEQLREVYMNTVAP